MNSFDLSIFNFIHAPAGRWFLLDWLVIFFAVYLGYILVVLFFIMVFKEKDRKKRAYAFAWWALSAIASRGIIAQVFYFFYHKLRPFEALGIETVFTPGPNTAFPSGHMAFYATFIVPVFYLNRKWGWIYTAAVVGMGIARIYGAVHWPTDIIAGIVIALAATYGVKYFLFKEAASTEVKKIEKEAEEIITTVE